MNKFSKCAFLFLFFSGAASASDKPACEENIAVGATYHVSQQALGTDKKKEKTIELWRSGNVVAHDHIDKGITLIWNKTSNGRLRVVQAFNRQERAIEYEPQSMSNDNNWLEKTQLFDQQLRDKMQLVKTEGEGCELQQTYSLKSDDTERTLVWLPNKNLASYYSAKNKEDQLTWQLDDVVIDNKRIQQNFSKWEGYQSTDYADIGDNESDPFLLKMINLGFISHGAEGFYDAEGNSLGSAHGANHGH
ncbi:hypothetical protein [Teredinibacter haidensis]|uniref:hypothetical protein n=1 Tax=Teredinibacter haidensis TaxID=2731755 RepID=UPI000948FA27|nr:hypothetical protein [Teredinibacter haidensis]